MPRKPVSTTRGVLEIDWPLFGELCRALALKVAREYDPELILGIAKPGIIPGVVIASILQRDFISMVVTRKAGEELPVLVLGLFVYTLVVSLLAAYIAGAALPPGSGYIPVFRFAGATAFIGYAVALWQMSIWWGRSWGMTARTTLDGLIYSLVTAGIFGAMWPA